MTFRSHAKSFGASQFPDVAALGGTSAAGNALIVVLKAEAEELDEVAPQENLAVDIAAFAHFIHGQVMLGTCSLTSAAAALLRCLCWKRGESER
jgi:hypothetical protein